jgi:hypothetical protein
MLAGQCLAVSLPDYTAVSLSYCLTVRLCLAVSLSDCSARVADPYSFFTDPDPDPAS